MRRAVSSTRRVKPSNVVTDFGGRTSEPLRYFSDAPAGPLRHAAREIDFAPADLPALVVQLDDGAHRPFADDAPRARAHVRNSLGLPRDERADRADSEGVADAVDVAPQGRLLVVDV